MGRGNSEILVFDKFTLNVLRGCLVAGEREIALRPKSFEVLRYLAENRGRLVSKDELFAAAWPGVSVTDESLSRCISDIRLALDDSGHQIIRTVPRRGYLFAAVTVGCPVETESTAAVRLGCFAEERNETMVPRLSLVVLPFINLSGDPSQEYLADVVTEGLTVSLSRIRGSLVIARTTAMTYKGKPMDVRRIGQEVGVHYIVEGSAKCSGPRLRVTARLIDAVTGAHLWADQFDAKKAQLAEMQDDMIMCLARALEIELATVSGTAIAQGRPTDMDAMALAIKAEAIFLRHGATRDATDEGYELCERALRIDPSNVVALSILAEKFTYDVFGLQTLDRHADLNRAADLVSRALTLDPDSYYARYAKAGVLVGQSRFEEAILEAEHCLALYPSFIPAYFVLCAANLVLGRGREMIKWAECAKRRSPRDPYLGLFWAIEGLGYAMLGDDDHAIVCYRHAILENPDYPIIYARLAAALVFKGHHAEAREMLERYLAHPRTKARTISQIAAAQIPSKHQTVMTFRERLFDGLRQLGMPAM
jgi:TolB-like protein